ncbi:MAG TPA: 4-hydroxyphenylacetate 3-hydroxylase N-terminal domain-containing protein, partial [Candidatus Binataceae bacterium]|nr:4-hydroxyphenylacetate 3-hydroxylase N-terminal domain-containing protein [Candidatus Binataceae bacterium]
VDSETRVIEKTDAGIVVRGGGKRAKLAPFAEELLVFPPASLADESRALAFAVPCNIKGLKFICHDSLACESSHFDAPLASRFDAMDAEIFFEDVMVPWERVFLCGDIERCRALLEETGAGVHLTHQEVVKNVAQAEFILGLAARIAEVIETAHKPDLSGIIKAVSAMRARLAEAETDAAPNRWGIMTPARAPLDAAANLFANAFPLAVDVIRRALPQLETEEDDRDRAALRHLAYDATSSAFAALQTPSEREIDDAAWVADNSGFDVSRLTQRIKEFLARTD